MAHIRQSRPGSGLGFQVRVLKIVQVVPSPLKRFSESTTPEICRRLASSAFKLIWENIDANHRFVLSWRWKLPSSHRHSLAIPETPPQMAKRGFADHVARHFNGFILVYVVYLVIYDSG